MFSDRANGKGIDLNLHSSQLPKFNISSDQVRIRQEAFSIENRSQIKTGRFFKNQSGRGLDFPCDFT